MTPTPPQAPGRDGGSTLAPVRLRLDLGYDGTGWHGWARQPDLPTVQGAVEGALGTVLRVPDPTLTVAGRTDTGVHARGQVAHLDIDPSRLVEAAGRSSDPVEEVLRRRLNGVLDTRIRVHRIRAAPPGFDARFSALWRRYAYRVADATAVADPLHRHHVVWWRRPLDEAAMNRAAAPLLGEHDFAAFCRRREGATTVRTLYDLQWHRTATGVLTATVRSDAFCHTMVRALVGCLIAVGEGRRDIDWPGQVLRAQRRDPAVTVVQAHGLTLEEVAYPAEADLAARAAQARARRDVPKGAT